MIIPVLLLPILASLALASPLMPRSEKHQIRSVSNPDLCLSNGFEIGLNSCHDEGDDIQAVFQDFNLEYGPQAHIHLSSNDSLCIDAGGAHNGGRVVTKLCKEDSVTQQFTLIPAQDGTRYSIQYSSPDSDIPHCLDVTKDGGSTNKPDFFAKPLQNWECHWPNDPDENQQFFELI
ncbi:uncharacterized protein IL334_007165 [Kwoniella shivajii]|uniref:Ricin B lectin domain-containing protein n=1 Tax=Kwoniella shivajii TaxID=564305 RepID=A0ABZ1D8P8_9TREE|nr:hypothetical protein IL334_007165 [Kwoniella shivajii]